MPIFKNEEHEKNYYTTLEKIKKKDKYSRSAIYLFTLDRICFHHICELYDFEEDYIIPEGLGQTWQSADSKNTTRLAFNLFCGCDSDGETYIGSDGYEEDLPRTNFTPYYLFLSYYAPYYVEALKLRFADYF